MPFIGKLLSQSLLLTAQSKLTATVKRNFQKTYLDGDITTGKNFLSFHVIEKYISSFIDSEIKQLQHQSIKIIALEQTMKISLSVPNIAHTITLKGKLDRIDEVDGITRIIDYKTGNVEKKNVEILSWDDLIEDYKYSKAFQLLCYSFMYLKETPGKSVQSGIISLKNIKEGVLLFAEKESPRGPKTNIIDAEMLSKFESALFKLIHEVYNPKIPFLEKEV